MITTSATQPGVQCDDTATGNDTQAGTEGAATPATAPAADADTRSAREIAMDALEAANHEKIDNDHVAEGLAPITRAPAPTTTAPATEADAQLAAQLGEGAVILEGDALGKTFVRTKVDGVEKLVPVGTTVVEFQKNGAADNRLEKASQLLREVQATVAARPPAGNDGAAAPAHSPTPSATPAATPAADKADGRKKLVTALFEGDEETALAALDEVIGTGRQAPIQVGQLASELAPVIRQQMSDEDALTKFGAEFQDIVSDPYLANLADAFTSAAEKEGKPFSEALMDAGPKVRDWLKSKGVAAAPPPQPQSTIDRTQKLAAKEGIDNLPALNRAATSVEEPVETHSSVIEDMRKARGLA